MQFVRFLQTSSNYDPDTDPRLAGFSESERQQLIAQWKKKRAEFLGRKEDTS
jgi:hypothetical protein